MFIFAQMGPQQPAPQLPPLPDGPDIARLRAPIEEFSSTMDMGTVLMITAAVLVLLGLILWFYKSRQKPALERTPEDIALESLQSTRAANLDDMSYATATSHALRDFLVARYAIREGKSHTTSELLNRIELGSQEIQTLQDFFSTCDSVKFAREGLSKDQRETMIHNAEQIIANLREGVTDR